MQLEFCEDEESVLVLDVVCGFDIADAKNILRDRPYDRCTFSINDCHIVQATSLNRSSDQYDLNFLRRYLSYRTQLYPLKR